MSVIFQDHVDGTNGVGLTTGNTTFGAFGLSSGTVTFDTSVHAAGASSAKCVQTASFGTASATTPYLGSAISTDYNRWCFQFGALPTGGSVYIAHKATGAGAFTARVALNTAGKLVVYNGTTLTTTGTVALSANTMYRIEWAVVGTTSTLTVYASPSSATVVDTLTTTITGTAWNHTAFGVTASSNSNLMTVWFDEVVIDSTTNPGPIGGTPASSTGGLTFSSHSTSSNGAHSTGGPTFGGTAQPTTAGGVIAGLSDDFSTVTPNPSKWNATGTVTQNNGAIVGCTSPLSMLSSSQIWDGTASQVFVSFSPPASGSGDTMISLVNSADSTKYAQMKVSAGTLSMTVLNGGADAGLVTRAVTADDNVIRFTEASGNVLVEIRPRGATTWATLRSFATPAWWNSLRVQLSGFSSAPTGTSAVFSHLNVIPTVAAGNPLASTLTDDFNGSSLDTSKWLVTGPGVVTVSSRVEVDAVNTGATDIVSVGSYVLDTLSLLVTPAKASTQDVTNLKALSPLVGTDARMTCKNGAIVAEYRVAGISDGYEVSATHDNTQPVYLRLSIDQINSVMVWAFSLDGVNFNALRTQGVPWWYPATQVAFGSIAH